MIIKWWKHSNGDRRFFSWFVLILFLGIHFTNVKEIKINMVAKGTNKGLKKPKYFIKREHKRDLGKELVLSNSSDSTFEVHQIFLVSTFNNVYNI